jgi:hypothetical protein
VIAPVVRRGGGCVGVSGVDVKIRCIAMFVLGHCFLHIPANALALVSGVSHLTIGSAEQSDTTHAAPSFVSRAPSLTAINLKFLERITNIVPDVVELKRIVVTRSCFLRVEGPQ